MFTDQEKTYFTEQPLARIATVSPQTQPDVAPVAYDFDGEFFYVSGIRMLKSLKYLNVKKGNAKVAFVVDDLASTNPWRPRGIKIHGAAELVHRDGYAGEKTYIKITPERKWSWGIEKAA